MIRNWFIMCAALCIGVASGAAEDEPVVFHLDAVNPSLPPSMEPPNLETLQAAVEHVVLACRKDDTMIVRLTCTGEESSAAWSLSCRVRANMLTWLREETNGAFLSRRRIELHQEDHSSDMEHAAESSAQNRNDAGSRRAHAT